MESSTSLPEIHQVPATPVHHKNLNYGASVKSLTARQVKVNSIPLSRKRNALIKRVLDISISSLLIVAVFPWFIPITAIIIKLDSKGPVFFRQRRIKKGRKTFTCIKLRTMYVNQDSDMQAATENDPRITRPGKFLRNTHLDELPQLWNVLWGDMSLIGPRPHMISDHLEFSPIIENYESRHFIKPGITGLAQVCGYTGPVTDVDVMKKRIEQDIYYIYQWNAMLDIRIIGRTFYKMFFMRKLKST